MNVLVCSGNEGKLREFRSVLQDWPVCGWKGLAEKSGLSVSEPDETTGFFLGNALVKAHAGAKALLELREKHGAVPGVDQWWILADDSGLCVPALALQPGVDSAIFAGEPRSDERNRIALARAIGASPLAMDGLQSGEKRLSAFFLCVLVALEPRHLTAEFIEAMNPHAPEFSQGIGAEMRNCERHVLHTLGECATKGNDASVESHRIGGIRFIVAGCSGTVSTLEQQLIPGEGHGYDAMFYPAALPHLSFASVALSDKNSMSHRGRALARLGTDLRFDFASH